MVRVLDPIWSAKPETASRVRGRIEAVLDAATMNGYREGPNPAQWKGNLAHILPARSKVRRVEHHPALPFDQVPAFLATLRTREGMAARALEFTILTAARTAEVLGARWGEIELDAKVWTVPAGRMKAGRDHRVPLSYAALAVLDKVRPLALMTDSKPDPAAPVFAGPRRALPMSNMVMLMLLRRMKRGDVTAHGFRSSFSDWAAERTGYPRKVVEMALAHAVENTVEAAYRRGDLFREASAAYGGMGAILHAAACSWKWLAIPNTRIYRSSLTPAAPTASDREVIETLRRQLAEMEEQDPRERYQRASMLVEPDHPVDFDEDVVETLRRQMVELEKRGWPAKGPST